MVAHFDPQTLALLATGTQLPALTADALKPHFLRQRFMTQPTPASAPLPQPFVHKKTWDDAAVLIPIVMRPTPTVLLTQRTKNLTQHAGQIAFPGGKTEASDASPIATALRETQEEIGLESSYIEVLGRLAIYATGTMFRITPVVALVQPDFTLAPNQNEVAEVFEVPLAFLMNPANHYLQKIVWEGQERSWLAMPYPTAIEEAHHSAQKTWFIWGATAAMLHDLYCFLAQNQP